MFAFCTHLIGGSMTTMNITLDQVDEHMKRLQEIKMFLENVTLPKKHVASENEAAQKHEPTMNLVIHEYWNK